MISLIFSFAVLNLPFSWNIIPTEIY